jgi:hypothetical protein
MKKRGIVVLMLLCGCGGSLSDEQRKKLHDGMETQKIQKVSESEILTASLERGREIFAVLEKSDFDAMTLDSLSSQYHSRISWIQPGSSSAKEVERQLIEAYVIGAETGSSQDNVQILRRSADSSEYDSLIYSRPVVTPAKDGAVNVEGVWNIYLSRKQVVLNLQNQ